MISRSKVAHQIKSKIKVKKRKNSFLLWSSLGLAILLFILIILVLKPEETQQLILDEYKNEVPTRNPSKVENGSTKELKKDKFELPASANPEIVNILREGYLIIDENARKLSIGGEINVRVDFGMTWGTEDGREIIDNNSPGIIWSLGSFTSKDVEKFKLVVLPKIESEFIKKGFIKDKQNSYNYPTEDRMFDAGYYVFNKQKIKCTISVGQDTTIPTDISIVCSDQYEKNYQTQTKIVNSLGSELSEHAKVRPLGEIKLFDRYGIFEFFGPGQYFLVVAMMDANDKWHILWQGFTGDGLPCELLDEHPILKKYYLTPYCYYREGKRAGEYLEWD